VEGLRRADESTPAMNSATVPPPGLSICLVSNSGITEGLIQRLTRSQWDHARMHMPDGSMWQSCPPGVSNTPNFTPDPNETALYFTLDTDPTPEQIASICSFWRSIDGQPYSYKGDLAFVTGGDPAVDPAPGEWFCSEAVFASLLAANIRLLNCPYPWLVNPGDIAWSTIISALSQTSNNTNP